MAATPKFWSALMSASIFPASTSFAPARDRSSKVMRFAAVGACCCAGADAAVTVGVTEGRYWRNRRRGGSSLHRRLNGCYGRDRRDRRGRLNGRSFLLHGFDSNRLLFGDSLRKIVDGLSHAGDFNGHFNLNHLSICLLESFSRTTMLQTAADFQDSRRNAEQRQAGWRTALAYQQRAAEPQSCSSSSAASCSRRARASMIFFCVALSPFLP